MTHVPVLVALVSIAAQVTASEVPPIDWQPYAGRAFDGSTLVGELGRIRVPERRDRTSDTTIELAFVRYRTTNPRSGPPIFYLAGGPGGSGVDLAGRIATHPQLRLLEHADVIGIDQRGTGLSVPCLTETVIEHELPRDLAIDRSTLIEAMNEVIRDTVAYWRERGVDLSAYNTRESADDIDDVRRALGVDRIVTYGTSYGSHLSLAYLRRYSTHVARALMFKVEGPDQTWKLPSAVQQHLGRLSEQLASDPTWGAELPNLIGLLRDLLARLAERPISVVTDDGSRVTVGPFDLQVHVARALASTDTLAELPATLVRLSRGDAESLASTALENRRAGINAMTLMMDCASGGSAARLERIERERRDAGNVLADAIMAPLYPASCQAAGKPELGDAFRAPFQSDVPVLFVSGTLDVRTPPSNVGEIVSGFAEHAHIVVENTGHDARELMSPEYRVLVQAFLRGEKVESCRIILPGVMLQPHDGGK